MPRAKKTPEVAETPVVQTETEVTAPVEEKAPKKSTTKKTAAKKPTTKKTTTAKKPATKKPTAKKSGLVTDDEKDTLKKVVEANEQAVAEAQVEENPIGPPVKNKPTPVEVPAPVEKPKRATRTKKSAQSEDYESMAEKRKDKEPILTIDDRLSVQTDATAYNADFLDIVESMKSGKILTDYIAGTENIKGRTVAVLWHGEIKVIIPLEFAVEPPRRVKGEATIEEGHKFMLTKRLGAEIDYVIDKVDEEAKVAVGNRLKAMAVKRKKYYFGSDKYGNNILYPDKIAEARVVATIINGIFVEVFGVETFIPSAELSYQRIANPEEAFTVGERVLVRISKIEKNPDDFTVSIVTSIKRAKEDPYQKAVGKLQVGSQYVGRVSMVDANGVFVHLPCGVDCLCAFPPRGRPVLNAQVTVVVEGINLPRRRIWGKITHSARVI